MRAQFAAIAERWPAIFIEDKVWSLSVHYRTAPDAGDAIFEAATGNLPPGEGLHVFRGKMVVEVKPAGFDKGRVLDRLLAVPPFAGRIPVFVGDDRTDEDGFVAVNRLGGVSIRVGPPPATLSRTAAQWQCTSVTELAEWLAALPARLA